MEYSTNISIHFSQAHCGHFSNVSIFGNVSKNGNISVSIFGNVSQNGNVSSQKNEELKVFFSVKDIDILVVMIA